MTGIIFILLLLFSCTQKSHWSYDQISTAYPLSNCKRVIYRSLDKAAGIDVEFLYSENRLIAYLQVHSEKIPPSLQSASQVRVKLISEKVVFSSYADSHAGGQRLRLSDALKSELIALLKNEKAITIEIEGYKETIDSGRFLSIFNQLKIPS